MAAICPELSLKPASGVMFTDVGTLGFFIKDYPLINVNE